VNGGKFWATRHGIATGGSRRTGTICDDLIVYGATLIGDENYGADFHGPARNSKYQSCNIIGGADLGGSGNGYEDCKITVGTRQEGIVLQSIADFDCYIRGCTIEGDVATNAAIQWDRPSDQDPAPRGRIEVTNNVVRVAGRPVFFRNNFDNDEAKAYFADNVFVGTDDIYFRSLGVPSRWNTVWLLRNRLHGTSYDAGSHVNDLIEEGTLLD